MLQQNKRIINEMKAEMIGLYNNLGDCIRKRDIATMKVCERKIKEMENLFAERLLRVYDCECGSDEDSDDAYEQYQGGKRIKCISCLRDIIDREKRKYPLLLDKLNWGLTGVLEIPSDESSGVTSSDQEAKKSSSFMKLKQLRKLRRQGPDKFQLKYFYTGVEEFLKMEVGEDQLKNMMATESAKNLLAKREQCKRVVLPRDDNFDDFAQLQDISSDTKLQQKLSNEIFHFIVAVISELEQYLTQHSKEYYPNVGEIISMSSRSDICKNQDALRHYYNVLHKRETPRQVVAAPAAEKLDPNDKMDQSVQDVCRTRKTSRLDLSSRGMKNVPDVVWVGASAVQSQSELKHLDLSDNSLTQIHPNGSCLKSLVTLKLTGNKLSKMPSILKKFSSLTIVDLANNKMTRLSKALSQISTLKELHASENHLETIPNELGNLKNLTVLDLRWNKLRIVPESLSSLCRLKVLNVGYNRLRSIPTNTNNVVELMVLDVSYNKISSLPPLIGMVNMMVFDASGNYIKQFPNLSGCKRLCEIRLDGNRIKSLSVHLLRNVPVVQMTLSYNKIVRLPDNWSQLETMVLLDLTGNRLTWLPWNLARLKYLSCVKVELNPIRNVRSEDIKEGSKRIIEILLRNLLHYQGDQHPAQLSISSLAKTNNCCLEPSWQDQLEVDAFYRNVNLIGNTAVPIPWMREFSRCQVSSLDLSKNKLGWLPYQLTMLAPTLQQLFVSNNCFTSIPEFINLFDNLAVLDLSGNHLSDLPMAIAECPLVELLCKFNQFPQIPTVLFQIHTLTRLDLSYNQIVSINTQGLAYLENLLTLNLHGNEIKQVPSALGFITNIKELDIGGNTFTNPDKSVLDKGTPYIMAYLRKHDDRDIIYKYPENPAHKDVPTIKGTKRITISKTPVKFSEL